MGVLWISWLGVWEPSPAVWACCGAAALAYRWFPGARRDLRALAWEGGVAVTLVALVSGLDVAGAKFLFTAHMAQHLMLAMVAPPLLIRGLPDATVDRLLNGPVAGPLRVVIQPVLAASIYFAVLVVWHLPGPLDLSLRSAPLYLFQHLTFLVVGLAFWWAVVIHRLGASWNLSPLGEVAYLTCGALPSVVVGLTLALLPRAIYGYYVARSPAWGFSPVADQHIGGLLMFAFDNLLMVGVAAFYFWRLFPEEAGQSDSRLDLSPTPETKKETRR